MGLKIKPRYDTKTYKMTFHISVLAEVAKVRKFVNALDKRRRSEESH